METIEFEKGWLAREMEEVRREVEKWPDVLLPLRTINSALKHPPSLKVNPTHPSTSQQDDLQNEPKQPIAVD